jgi:uncharacterized membrane protein YfcA
MIGAREMLLVLAAIAGGAVNAVAGGGTLLTFPALLAAGALPLTANATSTFSLVPGSLASFVGYRKELGAGGGRVLLALALPSLVGGWAGARLALASKDALFARLVPFLILGATLLFAFSERLRRRFVDENAGEPATPTRRRLLALSALQLLVAIYGGYFGAGMGILMLAALGFAGETNLHRMNALKSLAGACINGVGTLTFIAFGRVDWRFGALMAAGAVVGGYAGAGIARRVGQTIMRRMVIVIGVAMAAWTLWRQLRSG